MVIIKIFAIAPILQLFEYNNSENHSTMTPSSVSMTPSSEATDRTVTSDMTVMTLTTEKPGIHNKSALKSCFRNNQQCTNCRYN